MLGVNLAHEESQLDLLIVTDDDKDYLRKYAFRIIYALQHVYVGYKADIKRMFDARIVPPGFNYSCKKLLFLTWGMETFTQRRITRWLGLSPVKNINDRYILIMTEDLFRTILPDTSGEKMEEFYTHNQLKVNNFSCLDKWWPQLVGFLFNVQTPSKSRFRCYMNNNEPFLNCKEVVKTCIEYYNIRQKDRRVTTGKGCNVFLSSDEFPTEDAGEDDDNCVYICDRFMAPENTRRQYNKEHTLAGLLRIYYQTGVVKAPLKERIQACATWTPKKLVSLVRTLSEYPLLQLPFIVLAFILCVLGTSLPYWQGVVMTTYWCYSVDIVRRISYFKHLDCNWPEPYHWWNYDRVYILFGLFKVCINRLSFSALVKDCSEYNIDMPAWWRVQTSFCFLVFVLYVVSFVLIVCGKLACKVNHKLQTKLYVAATACHIIAGISCVVVLLIWHILGSDYIGSKLWFGDKKSSKRQASFYLFMVPPILLAIWISMCFIKRYYLRIMAMDNHKLLQLPFAIVSFILCVLGIGLPYWQRLVVHGYRLDCTIVDEMFQNISSIDVDCAGVQYHDRKWHILFGLFKLCISRVWFSATLADCSEYAMDLPTWWRIQTVICFFTTMFYFVPSFLLVYAKMRGKVTNEGMPKIYVVATVCHIIAGLLCIVILVIWRIFGHDYITSKIYMGVESSTMNASFYLFMIPPILQAIWIPLCFLPPCIKRMHLTKENTHCCFPMV